MSTIPEKKENIRICSDCKEKITISSKHPLCASCMARRSNKKRPPNKRAPSSLKRKEATQGKGKRKTEIGQPRGDFEVVFNEKYSQVLKEVEKLAKEEIRSIDEQIVFILKYYLKGVKEIQKT